MLLSLSNRIRALGSVSATPFVARVSEDCTLEPSERSRTALLIRSPEATSLPPGIRAYLLHSGDVDASQDTYLLSKELRYIAAGDVIRVDPSHGRLSALYRKSSPSNFFLVTERCDNFCVMCSQPPRDVDDSWLVDELLEVIPLVDPQTECLGITGGEPGLLGERLVELVRSLKDHLPTTALHVLSNGRAFARQDFARRVGAIDHPDLTFGIPLYSDLAEEHDFVVQAHGAYDETIRGILNLKHSRVRVEVRVVIHAKTVERLVPLAHFIARNLVFVDHVALMGLELTGFAKANLEALWIDPLDYTSKLAEAVGVLHRARVSTSIYNHQLCVLPEALHPFARKSISDWKNEFDDACVTCSRAQDCGGFFASGITRRSRGISPIARNAP